MNKTLLIVDDDEGALKTLVRYLGKTDYTVLTAPGSSEAFVILKNQIINVVISDFRMPDMNGIDFLKEVSKYWPDTVRIIISGYIELNLLVDSFNNEIISKFIPKPWVDHNVKKIISDSFDIYDLKKLLKKISGRSNKNMELIYDSLPAGIVLFDRSGKILSMNQAAMKLFEIDNTALNDPAQITSGSLLKLFTDNGKRLTALLPGLTTAATGYSNSAPVKKLQASCYLSINFRTVLFFNRLEKRILRRL
jgi:response regulator RpfG family c-di-GMP phosphodiesterase